MRHPKCLLPINYREIFGPQLKGAPQDFRILKEGRVRERCERCEERRPMKAASYSSRSSKRIATTITTVVALLFTVARANPQPAVASLQVEQRAPLHRRGRYTWALPPPRLWPPSSEGLRACSPARRVSFLMASSHISLQWLPVATSTLAGVLLYAAAESRVRGPIFRCDTATILCILTLEPMLLLAFSLTYFTEIL